VRSTFSVTVLEFATGSYVVVGARDLFFVILKVRLADYASEIWS
jgi:hypothetical protein